MKTNTLIFGAALTALAACGGGGGAGAGAGTGVKSGGSVTTAPNITKSNDVTVVDKAPKREVSKDAKADYTSAMQSFKDNDKDGKWSESACRGAADKFKSVVREHSDLVEAQFMVGLSLERCGLTSDAEQAYKAATQMKGDAGKIAMALSNLGELQYKAGKLSDAKTSWDNAIKANGKLVGARINVASLELEQMRKIGNSKDATWKKLEEDARFQLSNVLGVNSESVEAYTNYGLVYMEGWQQNKNRLDLAKTLLDEAKKRNEKYAPLQNAYGLFYLHRNSLNQAAQAFGAAVEADPKFVEARVNVGLLTLGFRKYDVAKEHFTKAIDLAPKNYDAYIGLGVALRGMNDLEGSEAAYKKAQSIDPRKGDAYYNLAVLYKDFRANKAADLPSSVKAYKQARDYFQQFQDKEGDQSDKTEAKEQVALIDKTVKQIEAFMVAQANQPPMPTATPTPGSPPPAGGTPPGAPAAPPAKK